MWTNQTCMKIMQCVLQCSCECNEQAAHQIVWILPQLIDCPEEGNFALKPAMIIEKGSAISCMLSSCTIGVITQIEVKSLTL